MFHARLFYTRERKCRHPSLDQSLDPVRALFTRHGFDPVKWHSIPTRPVRDHELLRISWKRRGRREPLVSGEDRKTIERPPYAHRSTTNFSPFHLALNIIRGTEYNLSCVDIWMVARAIKSSQDVSYACRNDDARASDRRRDGLLSRRPRIYFP